ANEAAHALARVATSLASSNIWRFVAILEQLLSVESLSSIDVFF
ncbi:hypothetical protein A2U01_0072570, partial [Trifolium medium]|nr:hypothetical protein [Trifolium medium]